MESGSAAGWANAAVTFMALIAASWAAVSTHRSLGATRTALELEQEREQRRVDADAAAQAARVAGWPVGRAIVGRPANRWHVALVNASTVPVYDVVVTFVGHEPGQVVTHIVGLLPPGNAMAPYPEDWTTETTDSLGNSHFLVEVPAPDIALTFTDAAGYTWQRSDRGALSLIHGDDSADEESSHPTWPSASRGTP